MQVAAKKVVSIDYTLTGPEGDVLDSSKDHGQPLAYLHGFGNIIPGLEKALEGKNPGDSLSVTVPPEQGYGKRESGLVGAVPRNNFGNAKNISVGQQFKAQTEHGTRIVTVIAVSDSEVTIDANHPLAGTPLKFDVKVVDVRDASAEELAHGHVHGPEGHHHH